MNSPIHYFSKNNDCFTVKFKMYMTYHNARLRFANYIINFINVPTNKLRNKNYRSNT